MKHCILIQAHKDISYFLEFARLNEQVNIYVHIDKKSNYVPAITHKNVFIIKNPINVYWGGWSQVKATLLLIEFALQNEENYYFHFCSGEDVILQKFSYIEADWRHNFHHSVMLESEYSYKHQYRNRFNYIHANTKLQRSILGKILTQLYKKLNEVIPSDENTLYGSSWFSLKRDHAEMFNSVSPSYKSLFKKKLCPDEHFFQLLAKDSNIKIANDNKRFIVFDKKYKNGNNPYYLNNEDLLSAKECGFWFARKVDKNIALQFLKGSY